MRKQRGEIVITVLFLALMVGIFSLMAMGAIKADRNRVHCKKNYADQSHLVVSSCIEFGHDSGEFKSLLNLVQEKKP